jgi:hypothetical protein
MSDRLDFDQNGEFDELVISKPDFVHIERMSDESVWIGIYKGDKRVSLFLSSRGKVAVTDGDGDLEAFFKQGAVHGG